MGREYQDLPELSRLIFSSLREKSWYQSDCAAEESTFPEVTSTRFGMDFWANA
jgi:hypothetical protein